jgi:hypothetical protein
MQPALHASNACSTPSHSSILMHFLLRSHVIRFILLQLPENKVKTSNKNKNEILHFGSVEIVARKWQLKLGEGDRADKSLGFQLHEESVSL